MKGGRLSRSPEDKIATSTIQIFAIITLMLSSVIFVMLGGLAACCCYLCYTLLA